MNNGTLTSKQSEAVIHLVEADTVSEAASRTGVSRTTLYEWMKLPAFRREIESARRAEHEARLNALRELLPKALKALSALLDSDDPRLRLKAAGEIVKACQALADKSASGGEAAEPVSQELPPEAEGSLTELTRHALRRLLNGTLEHKTAQMLPSYLRLMERFKKDEPGIWAEGKKGDEMKLVMGLLDFSLKPEIASDDPLLNSFQAEAKQFLLDRGWSKFMVEDLIEESRNRYSAESEGALP